MKKNSKGITLVALIITIIVLVILAGIVIGYGFNLIDKVKWASFKSKMTGLEEKIAMKEGELIISNIVENGRAHVFSEMYNITETNDLKDTLKYEILYIRDNMPESKTPTKEYYNLNNFDVDENLDGKIDDIYYVSKEIGGKEYAYFYDERTKVAFQIAPITIYGIQIHSYEFGNLLMENKQVFNAMKGIEQTEEEPEEKVDWVDLNYISVKSGEYKQQNGVYMCEPDLTGFDPTTTYYVTWDENGNETIGNTINRVPPSDWYSYPDKKWANVVSMANNKIAYWVWIPRYAYKINSDNQLVDIKFVNKQNECNEGGTITTYLDTTVQYDESGKQINYLVPEEFNWDNTVEDKKQLSGYWISKYELSDATSITNQISKFNIEKTETSIKITSITPSSGITLDANSYELYINGLRYTGTLPYTFKNLKSGKQYTIGVRAKTTAGIYTETNVRKITTLEKLPKITPDNPKELPDLTGFDINTTYYVTWDENGNETIGNTIQSPPPSDWYSYPDKKWANVVSMANNKIAYWVWIPKYEYRLIDTNIQQDYVSGDTRFYNVYINFVNSDKVTPTEGYIIPEEFTWENTEEDKKQLKGYWVSKYELSDASANTSQISKFNIEKTETSIKITSITPNGVTLDTNSYEFYLNGKKHTGALPYIFKNLTPGKEYTIGVRAKTTAGVYTETNVRKITTLETLPTITKDNPKELPDLTGFDPNSTYYVTWNDSGIETIGNTIQSPPPSDWYSYPNKKWANVVSMANNKIAYWVWIPRYEYRLIDTNLQSDYVSGDTRFYNVYINFVNSDKTTPTNGYVIPEEFSWVDTENNKVELKGYWVSKYELSDATTDTRQISKFNIEKTETSIKINSITPASGATLDANSYEFYLNGKKYTGKLPVAFINLTPGKEYTIGVRAKTTAGVYTETNVRKITTLETLPTINPDNPPHLPDLTGFDPSTTHYVTWDESGNETIGNTIESAPPSNWYSYPNKKWANVVSMANSKIAYWVWIPRYEYRLIDTNLQPDYIEGDTRFYNVYINFIDVTKTTPTEGYIIPEEFTWVDTANQTVQLKGYWVSKYELST